MGLACHLFDDPRSIQARSADMKANWLAALVLGSAVAGNAWGDLRADVYSGWQIDLSGNISTVGLTHLGTFVDPQIDHWDNTQGYRWNPLGVDELYTVTWAGYLLVPADGVYEFRSASDDGIQVCLDVVKGMREALGRSGLSHGTIGLYIPVEAKFRC